MACIVAPTRRQLSKRIPFTNPTFLKSRVGIMRSFIGMSAREEVAEQRKARLLTLFGMELHAEDVVVSDGGGEPLAVIGGGQNVGIRYAGDDIAVEKIKILVAD